MTEAAKLSPEKEKTQDATQAAASTHAASEKAKHAKFWGEKKFDNVTYKKIGYYANVLISLAAVLWVERTPSGKKCMDWFVNGVKNTFGLNPERAEFYARKSFFLAGGFAVLAPMKWREDKKLELVKQEDIKHYGAERVATDPDIIQSHKEIEAAPKQNWLSIAGSRALALVPFYLGYWLIWDRQSPLAKATGGGNPATMNDAKGVYVDRPIVWASRLIGKGAAKLFGQDKALTQLKTAETLHPSAIKNGLAGDPTRDPIHSAFPYVVISEIITSAMVAWGVYALTRVLGPLIGKKSDVPAPVPTGVKSVFSEHKETTPANDPEFQQQGKVKNHADAVSRPREQEAVAAVAGR